MLPQKAKISAWKPTCIKLGQREQAGKGEGERGDVIFSKAQLQRCFNLMGLGVVGVAEATAASQFGSFLIVLAAGTSHLACPFESMVLNRVSAPFNSINDFLKLMSFNRALSALTSYSRCVQSAAQVTFECGPTNS